MTEGSSTFGPAPPESGTYDIPIALVAFELLVAGTDRGEPLQPGFAIPKIESSLDRYGYVIFSGVEANEAADRAERAAAIEFEFAA